MGGGLLVSGTIAALGSMLHRRFAGFPPFVWALIVEPGHHNIASIRTWWPRDPAVDADGESTGGVVGGRQERAGHGGGDGPHGSSHPLGPAPDLREAVDLAAAGLSPHYS